MLWQFVRVAVPMFSVQCSQCCVAGGLTAALMTTLLVLATGPRPSRAGPAHSISFINTDCSLLLHSPHFTQPDLQDRGCGRFCKSYTWQRDFIGK